MKMSGYRATNVLLLVIYCLWCQVQPTAGGKCVGYFAIHACAGGNGKRSDVGDLAQALDLRGPGEGPDIEEGRGGERTGGEGGGGRESDEFQGIREGDDLRSEFSDRGQLLEERSKPNYDSRRRISPRVAPFNSALGRLRSLLRKTRPDDDDGAEEQREEEEPPRRSSTDTDRRYINGNTLTMLRRILDDIARNRDSQRSDDRVPDSVRKEQEYVSEEDNYYSLQKRAADQLGHTN